MKNEQNVNTKCWSVIKILWGASWSAALDDWSLEEDAGPLHVHGGENINTLTNQI